VMGKVRARLEVPPDISEADLQEQALASVAEQLDGKQVRRVIVRPPTLVNVVVG
jgi:leucyl-tRNA synthetase